MATKYIFSALAGSFAIAYFCDVAIADKKIFGGESWFSSIQLVVIIYLFIAIWTSCFFGQCYQVLRQALFQTRIGGKKQTKSFRLGHELLVLLW